MAAALEVEEQSATVLRLPPLTEEAALAWLAQRGEVIANGPWLAKQWGGWSKQRVNRKLERWASQRLIKFKGTNRNRRVVYLKGAPDGPLMTPRTPVPADRVADRARVAAVPPPDPVTHPTAESVAASTQLPRPGPVAAPKPASDPAPVMCQTGSKLLSLLAFFVGLLCIGVTAGLNAFGLSSFGRTAEAGMMMFALSIAIEVLAITTPTFATEAWRVGHKFFSAVLWMGYAAALAIVIVNGASFTFTQFQDTTAGRGATVTQRAQLKQKIAKLKVELAAVPEHVFTLPAAVDAATSLREHECDLGAKRKECVAAKTDEQRKIDNRTNTEKAERIQADLKQAEDKMAGLPVIASAAPQVDGPLQTPWLLGLVLLPSIMGGWLLAAGMLFWRGKAA